MTIEELCWCVVSFLFAFLVQYRKGRIKFQKLIVMVIKKIENGEAIGRKKVGLLV